MAMKRFCANKLSIQKVATNNVKTTNTQHILDSAKLMTFFPSNNNQPKVAKNTKEDEWLDLIEYANSDILSNETNEIDENENQDVRNYSHLLHFL
jgi:long-subunit acyl-CoA synthetase (AMP-forming)